MLRMRGRIQASRDSLFYVPTLFALAAIALAQGLLAPDRWITERGFEVPTLVSSTVDGARTVLGTVAPATIAFAGIAFSVALLTTSQGAFAEILGWRQRRSRRCASLLSVQTMFVRELRDRGLTERAGVVAEQAEHVVEACCTQQMLDHESG